MHYVNKTSDNLHHKNWTEEEHYATAETSFLLNVGDVRNYTLRPD